MAGREWYTIAEVANMIGLTPGSLWVRRWRDRRYAPDYGGWRPRYSREAFTKNVLYDFRTVICRAAHVKFGMIWLGLDLD